MILQNTNTEDKLSYCKEASDVQEPAFVEFINGLNGLVTLKINPDKEFDPYTRFGCEWSPRRS